jgi:hypothetical protein
LGRKIRKDGRKNGVKYDRKGRKDNEKIYVNRIMIKVKSKFKMDLKRQIQ